MLKEGIANLIPKIISKADITKEGKTY